MQLMKSYYSKTIQQVVCIFLVFFSSSTWSQNHSYSAYLKLENAQKVEVAEELANYYLSENIDSLLVLGEQLFFLGIDEAYPPAIETGKIFIAEYFIQTGKIHKGIELLKPMLSIADEQHDNKLKIAITKRITLGYCKAQDAKSALVWAKRLQDYKQGEKDIKTKIEGDLLYAEALLLNKKSKEAIGVYQNYINQAKQIKFYRGLASAYAKLGDTYRLQGDLKQAKDYFNLSLEAGKKSKLSTPQANAINNLAIIYFEENNLKKALENFNSGLDLRKKANNFRGICESYFNLGEYYFYTNDFTQAEFYYRKSEEFAAANELFIDQRDALKGIATCKKSTQDFEEACTIQEKIIHLQQEIRDRELTDDEDLSRLEQEIWKNDYQNNQTEKSPQKINYIPWILGMGFLMTVLLLIWKRKKTN